MKAIPLFCTALLLSALAWGGPVHAADIGDTIPTIELKDQSDLGHKLDDGIQRIYATADRKGDKLMKAVMEKRDQSAFNAQRAIVIADISEAPGFVKRIIKSSLKDRRYTTWLDTQGDTRALLPYRADQVVVIELERRRIKAIRYAADEAGLQREIEPTPAHP